MILSVFSERSEGALVGVDAGLSACRNCCGVCQGAGFSAWGLPGRVGAVCALALSWERTHFLWVFGESGPEKFVSVQVTVYTVFFISPVFPLLVKSAEDLSLYLITIFTD